MRSFTKTVGVILASAFVLTLASCGGLRDKYSGYDRSGERYDYDLTEYVAVPDYTGIEVPELSYEPS